MMTLQMSESLTLETTLGPPASSRLGAQRCLDDGLLRANPDYHHGKRLQKRPQVLPCPPGLLLRGIFVLGEQNQVGLWAGTEGAAAGAGHHHPPET